MIHIKCVVPECYIDTRLVQLLLEESERPNHQHGKGEVLNILDRRLNNSVAFGVIDEDRNKGSHPLLLDNYTQIVRDDANGLEKRKHRSNSHHLIIICPEIEKWLIAACQEVDIRPENYDLTSDLKGLKEVSKSLDIESHSGFKRLIRDLVQQKSARIICLKGWLWTLAQKN